MQIVLNVQFAQAEQEKFEMKEECMPEEMTILKY